MKLLQLIKKESSVSFRSLLILTLVSGVAQGLILAIINGAASAAAFENLNFRYLVLFGLAIAIFIVAKQRVLARSFILTEEVIARLRVRIGDKLRRSNLAVVERIGKPQIESRLTQDTLTVSQSAGEIANAAQSAVMIAVCVLYIATLSRTAFGITLALIAGGVSIYLRNQRKLDREWQAGTRAETEFLGSLAHLLDGFKELKVHRAKSDDMFERSYSRIVGEAREIKVRTSLEYVSNFIFSQTFFYVLIAVLVFLLPVLSPAYADVVMKATAAVLFIVGPLSSLVGAIPVYARSKVAMDNIVALESFLDSPAAAGERQVEPAKVDFRGFSEIALEGVSFRYAAEGFAVGPFDFRVKAGEVVFVVGGNGSGKSTLLKLFAGLYLPAAGSVQIDHLRLTPALYPAYRELFSVIFTDFHLFDRLYGAPQIDEKLLAKWLHRLELDQKTAFEGGRFTNLDLSTGQRKRLALAVACLEDRPILALDEFAADQDPGFRAYFYEKLLPELKAAGKTVIAVTHDDRYFHCADRVVKMEFGRIDTAV
ncbi:MAG TPA: cyclic peptide export ABC transporter [Opitutaceae bacterium]|nr:cyclic peptide export ABC transporter [Opitutaceae bacterium]